MATDVQIHQKAYASMAERLIVANSYRQSGDMFARMQHRIEAADITSDSLRAIWQAVEALVEAGTIPSVATVGHYLHDKQFPGGTSITQLMDLEREMDLVDFEYFIAKLKTASRERKALALAKKINLLVESGYDDNADEIREAREELAKLEAAEQLYGNTLGHTITAAGGINSILAPPEGQIGSPWPWLNRQLNGGISEHELWLLAARPSVGKTSMALQWAFHAAVTGRRVTFVSLEMSRKALLQRLFAQMAGTPLGAIRGGLLGSPDYRTIGEAVDATESLYLTIRDEVYSLREILALTVGEERPDLLVIDYLGLIETKKRFENRNQEVSYISRQLKKATTRCPILALAQLNRKSEEDKSRPRLSDLRDSGSLEQDADGVIFLHQGRFSESGPDNEHAMIIGKNRNGERDAAKVIKSDLAFCRFWEYEHEPIRRRPV